MVTLPASSLAQDTESSPAETSVYPPPPSYLDATYSEKSALNQKDNRIKEYNPTLVY